MPSGLAVPVFPRVIPPFRDRHTTLNLVIADPLLMGARKATLRVSLAILVAAEMLGAAGAPIVIGEVGAEGGPIPPPFAADTVKVTVVPSVRPGTTVVVHWPSEWKGDPEP